MYHRGQFLDQLFLAYISDLPESVACHIILFADDTLIYKAVNSTQKKDSFQLDIKALETWTRKWCMKFNADKCSVLVFNPSQTSPQARYTLNGNPLQITQKNKYLGVIIQSDLKFTNHIYAKISKAKRHYLKLQRKRNC